jgi:peroxiredoxin Q/BCP
MIRFADCYPDMDEDIMLKIGGKAPDFTLQSDDCKEVSLNDFKGKRVLIFFFPKANTSG